MTHHKPTKEELEAQIKATQDQLDKEGGDPEPTPSTPAPEDDPEPEPTPSTPAPSEPEKEGDDPEPTPSEPAPSPDYKEKFKQSARENQVQQAKNKQINEAIDRANALPDPTEEELQAEYTEWESMSDTERRLAKDSFINKRFREELSKARAEGRNIEVWNEKVEKFIDDPQTMIDNPELEGKGDDFKLFANKNTRRGLDFPDLVAALLYDATKNKKPKNKGQMFPTGSGGPNTKPNPTGDKIGLDEAGKLRKTNYKKYIQLLKAGKIKDDI